MPSSEPFGQRGRVLLALVLVVALAGLLVWYGALPSSDPATNHYPDEDHVAPNPDAFVGQSVVLGGHVVATDPVVIEITHDGTTSEFTIQNANEALQTSGAPLEPGDRVTAFGTLTDASTLEAERSLTREPWELQYMYVVSVLGGLWVAGRFVQGWRFDRGRLAFVPRADPTRATGRGPDSEAETLRYDEDDLESSPTLEADSKRGDR